MHDNYDIESINFQVLEILEWLLDRLEARIRPEFDPVLSGKIDDLQKELEDLNAH